MDKKTESVVESREDRKRRKEEKRRRREERKKVETNDKGSQNDVDTEKPSNGHASSVQNGENDKKEKPKKRKREETEDQPTKRRKSLETETTEKPSNDVNAFLTQDQAFLDKFRDDHGMTLEGDVTNWKPLESFAETGFPSDLLEITKTFKKPTPIQSQCWPIAISQRDIVGIAETGSGKTLAFGLPALDRIKKIRQAGSSNNKKPLALVLAPTRELGIQSAEVLTTAGKASKMRILCAFGGVDKQPQRTALRSGVDIIVATPGRLLDLVNEGECDLGQVVFLVLDEADRMLDLGFEKDIRAIIGLLPASRQTLMFSATWPVAIQKLAASFLKNPIKVTVGSEALTANKNVQQIVEVIDSEARDSRLLDLLKQYHSSRKNKVLVFVLYKKEATRVEGFLKKKGWNVTSIHGDKSQPQRMEALSSFTQGNVPLLIATDVAARGLDIPKVEFVINYSFPLTIEDYVHRIGRTGRAGSKGISHTFFQQFDKAHSGELVAILKEANQEVPADLLKFGTAIKKKEPKLGKISASNDANKHITFDSDDE